MEFHQITLEHIIPQNPKEDSNWLLDFDALFRKNYTYKLGNMTLLTNEKNAGAKNYDWQKKRRLNAQFGTFL